MSLSPALIELLLGTGITLLVTLILRYLAPILTKRSKSDFDDFVIQTLLDATIPLGVLITLFFLQDNLGLQGDMLKTVEILIRVVGLIIVVLLANKLLARFLRSLARRLDDQDFSLLVRSLVPLLQTGVWVVGTLILLQSLGVKMAVIWGLLSAGGIGLGLALKEPAQELFAYLMILLDHPFKVGQFISVGSISATVEKIGIRSTHLRSLRGEVVVMNNSTLTNTAILNFADMAQRRMIYTIGVTYDTDANQMQEIPGLIESIINSVDNTKYDRCHFTEFADSSLNFELVYYINTRVYTTALDAQQSINLGIMRAFEERGIEFAFPSQTLYLENDSTTGKSSNR